MLFGHQCAPVGRPRRLVCLTDAAPGRRDPTGTTPIRVRWDREVRRRFRALARAINEVVVKQDVLGLKGGPVSGLAAATFSRTWRPTKDSITTDAPLTLQPRAFEFERSADKVASFMEWVRDASADGILEVKIGTPMRQAAQASWQNVYIDTAYQKGIRDAGRRAGLSRGAISAGFNQPIHADAVGLIYTRAFEQLSGVTDAMSQQISRVLAQGLAEGRGTRELAAALIDRVESIGEVRARMIAQTETISAYAESTLNAYEEAGAEGVELEAEFLVTDDNVLCPECEALEGQIFTIAEARGMIPIHPNCRCSWAAIVK